MITARNYAAQAERDLRELAGDGNPMRDPTQLRAVATAIGEAQHFALPDGGKIFDDALRGLAGHDLRLPFDAITIEFHYPSNGASTVVLALEREREWFAGGMALQSALDRSDDDRFILVVMLMRWGRLRWMPVPLAGLIEASSFNTGRAPHMYPFVMFANLYDAQITRSGSTYESILDNQLSYGVGSLFEFLEALTCANVEPSIHQPATPKLNAKRVKAGKLPIYETKVLTIKPTRETGESRGPLGHERNGPRQHLRRGHIRRLPSGKNTWVQSCVVGSLRNGLIDKSYEVAR